jgi:superfamily II DNA or RNA helicase
MTKLVINDPPWVELTEMSELDIELAKRFLTYQDRAVEFLLQKTKKQQYWAQRDPEGWAARIEELKAQRKRCLLFQREDETYFTYSGLAEQLSGALGGAVIDNQINYPEPCNISWETIPPPLRPYQLSSKQDLLKARHGAVSIATGGGKSRILLELVHDLGSLRSLVVAPTVAIAEQLYKDFVKYLGPKKVGFFGGGKKHLKHITVAIAASLVRVEKGTEAWDWFQGCGVVAFDESHLLAATTYDKLATGVAGKACYRFSTSATQMRNDGADVLLNGLIGKIVCYLSVKDLVDSGYLAKPNFTMVRCQSSSSEQYDDVQKMMRKHHYLNPNLLKKAADVANKSVRLLDHSVLILIDEIAQFNAIFPYLKFESKFAYGQGGTTAAKSKLAKAFQSSDPTKLIKAFEAAEYPILVGTIGILGMGVDMRRVQTIIYLAGGKSPIQVAQAVGRGTRLCEQVDKKEFNFVDFCVEDIPVLVRHSEAREKVYNSLYPPTRWI